MRALTAASFWSEVNPYTHTPVNSVWLVVACCTCLNLIGIGSSQTIVAIFNITAPALDLSYVAVIVARMWYAHEVEFIDGPFTLGRWGRPINVISIVWVLFISVVLFFPPIKPVTATNMNYAVCVAAFMAAFALGWWWAGARKWVPSIALRVSLPSVANICMCRVYTGPRTKDVMEIIPDKDETLGYGMLEGARIRV